jgi:glycosyltransferase involved in cell wall biosynthesis
VGHENPDYQNTNIRNVFDNSNINVMVLPAVPNAMLYQYYSAADIAVFPRQNTLSALDAQACGLPVIMESDETNRERLKQGGLCYESGNMADLGKKMMDLLLDGGLRGRLSDAGRHYMQDRYNYKKKMTEIQDMLLSGFLASRFNKNGATS